MVWFDMAVVVQPALADTKRRSQAATRLRDAALGRPLKLRSTSARSAALMRD
jgi:hypothetical protein